MNRPGKDALEALLERKNLAEDAAYELMLALTDPEMDTTSVLGWNPSTTR